MLFSQPTLVGHRGAAAVAPENTCAGFHKAAAIGCRWVEFDVQLSADNIPIVFHDSDLKRIAGKCDRIADLNADELVQLDVGQWFDDGYRGERLPTLIDVIATLKEANLSANLDIKSESGREIQTVDAVISCLQQHWLPSMPIVISSFSTVVMQHLAKVGQAYSRGWLIDSWHDDWQQYAKEYGCVGLHVKDSLLTAARCADIRAQRYYVFAYTVNKRQRAQQLFNWGVTAICSDCPQQVQPVVV